MWEVTLPMKQEVFIMIKKKRKKGIFGKASNEDINELKEEGIETHSIPWIENKDN